MTQLTTIVTLVDGKVTLVRAHAGHHDAESTATYLAALVDAAITPLQAGTCVEMWPLDLYTDVGDVPSGATVRRHILTEDNGWVAY